MSYKKMSFENLPIIRGINLGFCFYKAEEVGLKLQFYKEEGGELINDKLPHDENHTLTAMQKLVKIQKEGHEVTTDLFIQLAWAVRERRNRDKMGWYSSVACKNTLNAVKKFIEKS